MKEALKQLLMTRAILNSHQRELVQSANIARCQIENQDAEAIKRWKSDVWPPSERAEAVIKEAETHHEITIEEAEICHATQAYDLEQSYKESVLKLEHEALAEEGNDCQAFMEVCSAAFWACPFEMHGY